MNTKTPMLVLVGASLAACGSDEDSVTLAVTVPQNSALVQSSSDSELVLNDSSNELIITSAELVLREIEFERDDDDSDCDDDSGRDDACEEFEVGPRLVSLPLDGSVDVELVAELPEGVYDEIEVDVHKVSDSDDAGFIADNPDLLNSSVRVRGTWNGAEFTFTSDVDEEREIELDDNPIVVEAGGTPVSVTLSIDVATWFTDASGTLIDPRTALDDGPNEDRVEDNIESSIDGYEDDDRDGLEDDDDDED